MSAPYSPSRTISSYGFPFVPASPFSSFPQPSSDFSPHARFDAQLQQQQQSSLSSFSSFCPPSPHNDLCVDGVDGFDFYDSAASLLAAGMEPSPASSPACSDSLDVTGSTRLSSSSSSSSSPSTSPPPEFTPRLSAREQKKARHREIDAARRSREAAALARLEALIAPPSADSARQKLDKLVVLEAVGERLARLQQQGSSMSSSSRSPSSRSAPQQGSLSADSGESSGMQVRGRKVACKLCHASKTSCDGARPCSRCVRMERADQCVDRPSKRLRTEPQRDSTEAAEAAEAAAGAACCDEDTGEALVAASDGGKSETDSVSEPDSVVELELQRALFVRSDKLSLVPLRWHGDFGARSSLAPRISLVMFSAHRNWFRLNNRAGMPRRPTCMLDKWLYWSLVHQNMDDRQLEDLVHASVFDPREQASVSPSAFFSSCSALSASSSSSLSSYVPCNGAACFGFCCFLRRFSHYAVGSYSWLSSPDKAIADWTDAPNHPVLILRNQVTEEAAQAQNCRLETLARAVLFHPDSCPRRRTTELHINAHFDALGQGTRQVSWFMRPKNDSELAMLDSIRSHRMERFALSISATCCRPPMPPAGAERIEVDMAVQANCSLERFLGYTQAELRQRFLLDGELALYHLIRPDCWDRVMTAEHGARVERQASYSLCIVVLNRWGAEMSCLLHCMISFFNRGGVAERKLTFIPLSGQSVSDSGCEQLNDALDTLSAHLNQSSS